MKIQEVYKKMERERIAEMLDKIDRLDFLSSIYEYTKMKLDYCSQNVKGGAHA